MTRTITKSVGGAALALALALPGAEAAAQNTYRACRVPTVGAIYMIGVTGAPTACLDASHVEFSWTEGGAPPDGSITTVKLANDAVTSAKIADGAVTSADIADGTIATVDIADGAITQVKLDAGVGFPPPDGSITTIKLANDAVTSAKIADGTIAAADIGVGAVGSAQVADNSLTAADLADGAAGRMAMTTIGTVLNIGTTNTNLGSVSINAPAAGTVWIALTGYAVTFGDNTVVQVGLGTSAASLNLHSVQVGVLDGVGTQRREFAFSPMTVASVSAGTTTFFATALKPSVFSAQLVNLAELRLIVIYQPL